ncbi:MAG TPA: glycosyltransferase family 4 protein [Stellaceae bacterium]|nr:glycosyltransferase family 4 protein [Stellaceae bacterium]
MKIAEFCPYAIDRPGGVQAHIRDLAVEFRRQGHDVVIIAPGGGSTAGAAVEEWRGIRILRIGAARLIGFYDTSFELTFAAGEEYRRLAAVMRDERFDVVHFHTIWTPALSLQAFRLSRAVNVATFHSTLPHSFSGRATGLVLSPLGRWLLPRLDGVIAVSATAAANLRSTSAQPVSILPPCTDLAPFMAGASAFSRYRDGRLNILYLGRLEPRKGLLSLLEAYRRLAAERADLRLLLAGDGPQRAELEAFVRRHALPAVEFLGRISEVDKPRWYATADLVCAPALHGESFGIVVAEAMASGKPVTAAANDGYRRLLTGIAADLLFPPGDAAALQNRLARLADDAALRRALGEWGRAAAARYDCQAVVPQLLGLFAAATARAAARKATPGRARPI